MLLYCRKNQWLPSVLKEFFKIQIEKDCEILRALSNAKGSEIAHKQRGK